MFIYTSKGKKIAETLCVLFLLTRFYAQRSRCFRLYIFSYLSNGSFFVVVVVVVATAPAAAVAACTVKFQINLFVSHSPTKWTATMNAKSIDCRKIPLHVSLRYNITAFLYTCHFCQL